MHMLSLLLWVVMSWPMFDQVFVKQIANALREVCCQARRAEAGFAIQHPMLSVVHAGA